MWNLSGKPSSSNSRQGIDKEVNNETRALQLISRGQEMDQKREGDSTLEELVVMWSTDSTEIINCQYDSERDLIP